MTQSARGYVDGMDSGDSISRGIQLEVGAALRVRNVAQEERAGQSKGDCDLGGGVDNEP